MKVLIFGGSGMIGFNLFNQLKKNYQTEITYNTNKIPYVNAHQLDITDKDSVIKLICKINPDIVINTVALVNVDLAEKNNELSNSITVEGVSNVISGCKKTKSKIVYVSTTHVFDGQKSLFYENDKPSPFNYYGLSKFRAEELIRKSGLCFLILRTDQPYYWTMKWQRSNSVLRVIETLGKGQSLQEITDWYNVPTYIPDFVSATEKLIENNEKGIFHVTGSDYINRFDWSCNIAEIFGLDKNLIQPIKSSFLNLTAKRKNVNVSNEKIQTKTGIKMKGVREGALNMLKNKPLYSADLT